MTHVHSHIKSVDHFDQLWNSKVKLFREYFVNTPLIAFAHRFNITSFIRSLSDSLFGLRESVNENHLQSFSTYNSYNTKSFIDNYTHIISFLLNFEPRKKTISAEKLNTFVNEYDLLSNQDRKLIILPYQLEEFVEILFCDFYPSVCSSFQSFMVENNIMYSDKKNKMVYIKNFTPTNDQIMSINSSASFVLKSNFASNFIAFDTAIQQITNLVNSLMSDNAYLENRINQISKELEKQNKEGINGYLMTWH